jgi:hypothetical protein
MPSLPQRHYDRLASNLLYLSLAFGFGVMLLGQPSLLEDPVLGKGFMLVGIGASAAFLSYQYYCIRQGKGWAKVLLVVWLAGGLLLSGLDVQDTLQHLDTPWRVANFVLGYLCQAVAVVLVFRYKLVKGQVVH